MVPEGWSIQPFSDVTRIANGQVDPTTEPYASMPHIAPDNIESGSGRLSNVRTASEAGVISGKYPFEAGAIIYSKIRPNLNKVARTPFSGVCSADMYPVYAKESVLDQEYLFQFMQSGRFLAAATAFSMRTGLPKINRADLGTISVPVPPLREQKKVADVLSKWDKAIETTEKLHANAEKQKRALMQQLLTGKRRLKSFEGRDWKHVSLDTVFERVRRKNADGIRNVLTISGKEGLVSQREYFNKLVAAADTSGYTLLRGGEFAYNKSYSAGYPLGAIKMLPVGQTGVLSSLYICFRIRSEHNDCADFFRHWFEFGGLNRELSVVAQEGARNHGLLNVGISDFFGLLIYRPEAREQNAIAELLNDAEQQVRNFELQLARLVLEKRALMQVLLTGKRRVKYERT
ncbi:restriction endonuclease subunit S [Sinorhizobium meliloti]|uniref:restriction endonuclease subunit S n=1 Tax=Rhizobium meliloti TaxID=382 RepID=UPI003D662306